MSKRWIALFSQTGSEINNISKKLGRYPDLCITNRWVGDLILPQQTPSGKINSQLLERSKLLDLNDFSWGNVSGEHDTQILLVDKRPEPSVYFAALGSPDDTIVTLHGWLRIVPPQICSTYEIYNGHPGLITKFPELKGKDPQKRTWEGNYKTAGTVIHRVTAGVDEGPVVLQNEIDISDCQSEEVLFEELKEASLNLWLTFFYERGFNKN